MWRANSAAGKETERLIWEHLCPLEAHAPVRKIDIKYVITSAASVREAMGALGQKKIPVRGTAHQEARSTGVGGGCSELLRPLQGKAEVRCGGHITQAEYLGFIPVAVRGYWRIETRMGH